ncbi:MAG: DUF2461 domain-containing protein [Cyclobacteriaceae bacterium]|nr:DUF2461 domain-containing protein [Cyclobacteriaceae bacterium]
MSIKQSSIIQVDTMSFLKKLAKNNNREWFEKHKEDYLKAQQNLISFADALIAEMNKHDQLETPSGKKSLYRIYNDVRFSKDKTPYSPRFAGYLKRLKPGLRGGYYYWIKPGASRIACGFAYPNAEDLNRARKDIEYNYEGWRKLLSRKTIQSAFGEMTGEQVKTTPRGFDKDHPAIDLLRYKNYWFEISFTDAEVTSPNFVKTVNQKFKSIRPFFDYMSSVLTTNENGEPL